MIQRKKLKGPQRKRRKKKKNRSDAGGLSGKMERETRSGTVFKRMASRWLPWACVVRSRIPGSRAGRRASTLLVTEQGKKWPVIEGLMCAKH